VLVSAVPLCEPAAGNHEQRCDWFTRSVGNYDVAAELSYSIGCWQRELFGLHGCFNHRPGAWMDNFCDDAEPCWDSGTPPVEQQVIGVCEDQRSNLAFGVAPVSAQVRSKKFTLPGESEKDVLKFMASVRVVRGCFHSATRAAGARQRRGRQDGPDCQETLRAIKYGGGGTGTGLASGRHGLSQLELRTTPAEGINHADTENGRDGDDCSRGNLSGYQCR
jgi:hypothetical protein